MSSVTELSHAPRIHHKALFTLTAQACDGMKCSSVASQAPPGVLCSTHAALCHAWSRLCALARCSLLLPSHAHCKLQVVESHNAQQPQPNAQTKEELSEMPVRALKTMLQSKNISFAGCTTSYPAPISAVFTSPLPANCMAQSSCCVAAGTRQVVQWELPMLFCSA